MVMRCQEISEYLTYGQMNLINEFRYNIVQLVMWSRSFVNSTAANFTNLEATTKKLFTIPLAFYQTMKPYLGDVAAAQLQSDIFQHTLIFTKIVNGFKNGNNAEVDENIKEWYKNADNIAAFLAESNLYWDREHWRSLIYQYMELTIEQVIAILSRDHEKDISIYDRLQHHALIMADFSSKGIIQTIQPI